MKFSIITVNYNNKDGLQRTIESVINQTFRDYEFIVIDGGSSDGSIDVLNKYNEYITYWVSEPDGVIYQGMNKGISKAKGDYLNFMNSGDCFYDTFVLQEVVNMNLDHDIIIGQDYHFSPKQQKGFATILPTRTSMITLYMQALPHQSTFYKSELFINSLYDESLKLVADHKFNIQKICVDNCRVIYVNKVICFRESGGLSDSNQALSAKESSKVMEQFLPIGVIKDYKTLSYLGKSTVYKLMNECENETARRLLIICVKIIYKLIKFK